MQVSYIKKPVDPVWGSVAGALGQFVYNEQSSTQFELHPSEQTELILKILMYAGVIIEDPSLVQIACYSSWIHIYLLIFILINGTINRK